MRKFLTIALLAALPILGGCAELHKLQDAFSVLTQSSVSPQAVVIITNSFNAAEASATNYLRLPKCTGSNGPVCRDPVVATKVIMAVRQGRVARDNLLQFAKTHPGQLGTTGLYDALQTSINTISSIITTH